MKAKNEFVNNLEEITRRPEFPQYVKSRKMVERVYHPLYHSVVLMPITGLLAFYFHIKKKTKETKTRNE